MKKLIFLLCLYSFYAFQMAAQNTCDCTTNIVDVDMSGQCKFVLTKERIGVQNCTNLYIQVNDSNPANRDTIDEPGTFIYLLINTNGTRICNGWLNAFSRSKPNLDSVNYTKDTLIYTKIFEFLRSGYSVGRAGTFESPLNAPFKMTSDGQLPETFFDTIPNLGLPYFSPACKISNCTLKLSFTDEVIYSNCAKLQTNPLYATIVRTWTVEDCNGNTHSTIQYIYFKRPKAKDFTWNFNKAMERTIKLNYGECTLDPRLIPINACFPIAKESKLGINDYQMDYTLSFATQFDTVCNGQGLTVTRRFIITDDCTNSIIDSFKITLNPNGDLTKWASIPVEKTLIDLQQYCLTTFYRDHQFLIDAFKLSVNSPCKPILIRLSIQHLDLTNFNEEKWVEATTFNNGLIYYLTGGKYRLLVSAIDSCNNIHLETIPFQIISTLEEVIPDCLNSFDVRLEANGQKKYLRIPKSDLIPTFQPNNCSNFALAVRRLIDSNCLNNYLSNPDYDLDKDGNVIEHFQRVTSGQFQNKFYSPWMPYIELFECDDSTSVHYESQYRSATGRNFSYTCSNTIQVVDKIRLQLKFEEHVFFKNQQACIPLIVDGFRGINASEFSIQFDPSLLKFEEAKTHPALGPGEFIFRSGSAANTIWFSWVEWREKPIFLQPRTSLLELCFTPLSIGSSSISIDTLNRLEFHSPLIPIEFSTLPGQIQIKEPGDYTLPIQNLNTDSIKIQTNKSGKLDISKTKIFPNPSSDKLFIQLPPGIPATGALCLKDLYGRVLIEKTINAQQETLDLNGIVQGIYFLEINIQNTILAQRVLVLKP